MTIYYVEAIDKDGKKIKKTFRIEKEEDIFSLLEFLGLTPVKIKKIPTLLSPFYRSRGKIKKKDIIEILENLHLIVKSGLPLNVGLQDLAQDAENEAIRDMLMDIAFKIQVGYQLSEAVKPYRKYFSDVVISLFKIGEETGSLERTLKDAAEHLKKIEDLKAKAKQALIYPAFAFVSILIAMIFWLVYVLPKILQVFKDFNMQLPITTIIIMKMSEYTQKYILVAIGSIFVGFILIKLLRKKSEKFKYYTDKLLIKLPIFGNILLNFNYAFFAEYIKLMIAAGLPLYQALEIMENAMENEVFKKAIKDAREKIALGETFSQALRENQVFSPLILRMISVGEQTGQLENQLEYIAEYYYQKVDYISQNIAKMIEPIIIGFLGIFMLLLVLGLIGPIYQLISNASRI